MNDNRSLETVLKSARGSNQSGMRAHNERIVLTLVRQNGALPKADIARLTGLSAQTVSVIMRGLEADGLLQKEAPNRGKVGQPSVPMGLNANGAFFLGLKVGRRSLDLILTDFLGNEFGRQSLTHRFPTPDRVVKFANEAISALLGTLNQAEQARVAGLGIAIPFRLWAWAKSLGVRPQDMEDWRHCDIASEIAANWPFPVFLQNDATAACGAELVFGRQDNPEDFLYFFVGFFVGGGLVLNNGLYTGRTGNAAALGSMPVLTRLGRTQQLIDVASLATLEQSIIVAGADANGIWQDSQKWDLPEGVLNEWIDDAANGLAQATLGAACLIDFESVVIDGWMPEDIRAELVSRTNAALLKLPAAGIDLPLVREGSIGPDARALGAASLPLSERFLIDKNSGISKLID